jgi:hypothetical protein
MTNWIRSRAAKRGVAARQKATCAVCGKGIWNRMLYRLDGKEYAHTGCIKPTDRAKWERTW